MALEIFPTDRDVGSGLLGRKFTEDKWEELLRGLLTLGGGQGPMPGHVITGLDTQAPSGLNVTFNTGDAVVAGFRLKGVPQTVVALPASQSNINVYLELTKDANGDISGAQFTTKTDYTLPTNAAILLRYFKTGASSVTVNEDRRAFSGRVYTTNFDGDGQGSRTIMVGFAPRFAVAFLEPVAGTDSRIRIAIFVDGANDRVMRVDDTGAGATDLMLQAGAAVFVAGGIVVTGAMASNNANKLTFLAVW